MTRRESLPRRLRRELRQEGCARVLVRRGGAVVAETVEIEFGARGGAELSIGWSAVVVVEADTLREWRGAVRALRVVALVVSECPATVEVR